MPRHDRSRQQTAALALLASTAARLMAQDGINDPQQAKRKAARQLGLPDHVALPSDQEVAAELRLYQLLYKHEQGDHLRCLREEALALMRLLQDFHPYLTGSVLDGTATEFSDINIQLFADSAKEVEIFLLNQQLAYRHEEPRSDKAEAVLVVETESADANLVIYPAALERVTLKHRDGRPRERMRAEALAQLLEQTESCP